MRPRFALDRGDERLTHLVLTHLRLETHELLQERRHARALTALLQHARHTRLTGDVLTTELVHHAVAVAFEQRHQGLHVGQRAALLFARDQGDDPAVVEWVPTVAELVGRARQRLHETARIRIDRRQGALHQREVVRLHPRHAGELGPVGDLVDRDPQTEVARAEREALLQREDVAPDVIDRVGRRVVVEHEQVVLAEHALGEVPEQHAGLGPRHATADGCDPTARHPFADARGQWGEQAAHRRDVRLHPRRAVDDLGARRARGAETGVVGHERLGLRRDRLEVVAQGAGEVRRGERFPSGKAAGDPLGELPVDRVVDRRRDVGGLRHHDRGNVRHGRYLPFAVLPRAGLEVMRTGDPGAWGG